jgi:hypothetical protein
MDGAEQKPFGLVQLKQQQRTSREGRKALAKLGKEKFTFILQLIILGQLK